MGSKVLSQSLTAYFIIIYPVITGSVKTQPKCLPPSVRLLSGECVYIYGCYNVPCPEQNTHCVLENNYPQCQCLPGYVDTAYGCQQSVSTSPCQNVACGLNSECVVSNGLASCQCQAGYARTSSGCTKTFVDYHNSCQTVACGLNSECVVTNGQASCQCVPGYEPTNSGCIKAYTSPCQNVNCGLNAGCVVSNGQGTCQCDPGYQATDLGCTQKAYTDPCQNVDCGLHAECIVAGGKAACTCMAGYDHTTSGCIPQASVGCTSNANCASPMVCINGWCAYSRDCSNVACGNDSRCVVKDGQAICSCVPGYVNTNAGCIQAGVVVVTACLDIKCPVNTKCVMVMQRPMCLQ